MLPRLILLASLALPAAAQSIATNAPTRVAAYTLDTKVDPDHHTLTATETITWHSLTGQPLTTFPFHLYLSVFPQSTFTHETHFGGGIRDNESDNAYPNEKLRSINDNYVKAMQDAAVTTTH